MVDVLSVNNLSKDFGKVSILKDVTFNVGESEIFGLVGLNGVGKTTIIKSILGLISKTSGTIEICGINNESSHSRQNTCYLPEKFLPSPHLKATEFINLVCSFYNKKPLEAELKETAELLGLKTEYLNYYLKKLSKGSVQKIGLIACVLSGAKLLILDEPFSGLDVEARVLLKNYIKRCKSMGQSIFLSSHILADIEELCDKISVITSGTCKFTGHPKDFRQQNGIDMTFEECFISFIKGSK